jgi:hypothetical protein
MLVITDKLVRDPEVCQQFFCVTRILTRNDAYGLQRFDGSEREVL